MWGKPVSWGWFIVLVFVIPFLLNLAAIAVAGQVRTGTAAQ